SRWTVGRGPCSCGNCPCSTKLLPGPSVAVARVVDSICGFRRLAAAADAGRVLEAGTFLLEKAASRDSVADGMAGGFCAARPPKSARRAPGAADRARVD